MQFCLCKFASAFFMVLGVGVFTASMVTVIVLSLTQNQLYARKQKTPVPISGEVTFGQIDDTLYAFVEYQAGVNAYDLNGHFKYSIKIPQSPKGKGKMYIKNNLLFLVDRSNEIFWYENGDFKGNIQTRYTSNNSVEFAVFNEKQKLISVTDLNNDRNYTPILYLDNALYYYHYSDCGNILYKNDGKTQTKIGAYRDNNPPYIDAISNLEINGAGYSEDFENIHMSKENQYRIIAHTPFYLWCINTPLAAFVIMIFGVLLSRGITAMVKSVKR